MASLCVSSLGAGPYFGLENCLDAPQVGTRPHLANRLYLTGFRAALPRVWGHVPLILRILFSPALLGGEGGSDALSESEEGDLVRLSFPQQQSRIQPKVRPYILANVGRGS